MSLKMRKAFPHDATERIINDIKKDVDKINPKKILEQNSVKRKK